MKKKELLRNTDEGTRMKRGKIILVLLLIVITGCRTGIDESEIESYIADTSYDEMSFVEIARMTNLDAKYIDIESFSVIVNDDYNIDYLYIQAFDIRNSESKEVIYAREADSFSWIERDTDLGMGSVRVGPEIFNVVDDEMKEIKHLGAERFRIDKAISFYSGTIYPSNHIDEVYLNCELVGSFDELNYDGMCFSVHETGNDDLSYSLYAFD